jgi:DNA-binding transcriptional MerR regulator
MSETWTIGKVARETGLSTKTIRFYESEGVLAAPARTESGYRQYSDTDVRRLRLARRARLLGLPLPVVKTLVDRAFRADCIEFADQLLSCIEDQRGEIDRRIAELQDLKGQLGALEQHVRHCQIDAHPGQKVTDCGFCPMIDAEKGGECHDC